jgi:hypothetical protein
MPDLGIAKALALANTAASSSPRGFETMHHPPERVKSGVNYRVRTMAILQRESHWKILADRSGMMGNSPCPAKR